MGPIIAIGEYKGKMTFPKLITLRIKEGMEGGKRGGEERGEGREGKEEVGWRGSGKKFNLQHGDSFQCWYRGGFYT